ncbi:efflux RND transporter periplasmic adaptor subunit [Rhodopirellula sp. JC737]|nr:efflux RND transporter periplasmic adaptor subunit [Rhodopirellula sp. JC737]
MNRGWPTRSITLVMTFLVLATVLSIVLGTGVIALDPAAEQQASKETAPRLHVRVAEAGSIEGPELFHQYRGEIIARRDSSLAMRRGGRLVVVAVHEGDTVKAGDVLARIDISDLDAAAATADADVASAKAVLDEAFAGPRQQTIDAAAARVDQLSAQISAAENRFLRQESLRRRGAGTQQEFDDAKYAVDALKADQAAAMATLSELREGTRQEQIAAAAARLEAAKATRKKIEVDRADSQIIAPFDGVIAERLFDEGAIIGPNQPVLRILEAPPVHATFGVPVDVADRLRLNDSLKVSIGKRGIKESIPGSIIRMQPQIDPITRTRRIELRLHAAQVSTEKASERDSIALIGNTATLWIPWSQTETQRDNWIVNQDSDAMQSFWMPTAALVRGVRGLWSVYVAEPQIDADATQRTSQSNMDFPQIPPDASAVVSIQRRDVKVLRTAGQMSLVSGPVATTDALVIEGTQRVGPGVRAVAVWRTAPSSSSEEERKAR